MNCLKCGKETRGADVFCENCLQDARSYPVKPGTAIHLQQRDAVIAERKKTPLQIGPTPNEQIRQLRRTVRRLSLTVAVLSVVLCLIAALLIHNLSNSAEGSDIGRNHTLIQP